MPYPSHRSYPSLVALLLLSTWPAFGGQVLTVTVDCGNVIARRPEPMRFGICMNYLIDSDNYDPKRKIKLRDSLRRLNVKAIRWNEGEVGDKMIWAIPPFTKPDAHATHLRTPGTVHHNWRVDESGKLKKVMQLDEAIAVARDLGIELFLIVGIDAIWLDEPSIRAVDTSGKGDELGKVHKRMSDFPWMPKGNTARDIITEGTRALALYLGTHASDLEVFLEIGNENYLGDANWKPERYAELVNALAAAIKKANPKLRVGAQAAHQFKWTSVSADGEGWNETVRETLDFARLDFLIAHQYGCWDTKNLDSAVALLKSLPAEHRDRLEINVTELGVWHLPGSKERWSPNTLRTSLYQFRWLGLIQTNGKGKVRTPLFWTTRWLDVLKRGPYEKSFNAIDLYNRLVPSGQALRLWNNHVHDSLVETTVTGGDRDTLAYASRDTKTGALTVWLVNIHPQRARTTLYLKVTERLQPTSVYVYAGNDPSDTYLRPARLGYVPWLKRQGADRVMEWTVKPYSLTIFRFTSKREAPIR
jgi:hypothetical protein